MRKLRLPVENVTFLWVRQARQSAIWKSRLQTAFVIPSQDNALCAEYASEESLASLRILGWQW